MNKNKPGFGIVEVLIATTIIAIIIFALTAAGRSALRSSIYLRERTQASYLAQGGLEAIRQIRDSNWVDSSASTDWSSFGLTSTPIKDYAKDASGNSYGILSLSGGRFRLLGPSSPSIPPEVITVDGLAFNRIIIFKGIAKDQAGGLLPADTTSGTSTKNTGVQADINSVKVTVQVTWENNGETKQVSVSEILTNWRPNY